MYEVKELLQTIKRTKKRTSNVKQFVRFVAGDMIVVPSSLPRGPDNLVPEFNSMTMGQGAH
jgi:hypothetical protein